MMRTSLIRLLYVSSFFLIQARPFPGAILQARDAEPHPVTILAVRFDRGALTVDVRNAPLAQVLQAIGEQAGLHVTMLGDVSGPVTASFAGLSLAEGLRQLTRGYSLALTTSPGPAAKPSAAMVTRVWVIGRVSTPEARPAAPNASGAAPVSTGIVGAQHTDWLPNIRILTDDADRGSAAAVARLGDLMVAEMDAAVRHHAVAALGRLTDIDDVEALFTEALSDVDRVVRVRAVRGLRGAGTATAVQTLTEVLMREPEPEVRLAAVRALVALPSRTILAELDQASVDPDAVVRETARRGLSWWKTHLPHGP